jgi:cell division control protein 6
MPSPHKRTRSGTSTNGLPNNGNTSSDDEQVNENDEIPSPTPAAIPIAIPRTRRQAQAQATTMTPPSTRPRPSGSGSSSTGLARANSLMFTPSTRRTNNSSHGATPFTLSPTTPSLGGGGTGMLLRTQSYPTMGMGSPSFLKSPSISGGSAGRGKGDDDYFSLGPRRPGQGKENIPPKKNDEREETGSRKRLRVSSRSGGRGRSGSVSSLRSETPSSKSLFFHWPIVISWDFC